MLKYSVLIECLLFLDRIGHLYLPPVSDFPFTRLKVILSWSLWYNEALFFFNSTLYCANERILDNLPYVLQCFHSIRNRWILQKDDIELTIFSFSISRMCTIYRKGDYMAPAALKFSYWVPIAIHSICPVHTKFLHIKFMCSATYFLICVKPTLTVLCFISDRSVFHSRRQGSSVIPAEAAHENAQRHWQLLVT
jgi:hypothetical protein